MSELDPVHDALERLEWVEAKQGEETPVSRFRAMTRRSALTGSAAGVVGAMLAACGSSNKPSNANATPKPQSGGGGGGGIFGSNKKYKFVLVNHVTTNPFFVPT